MDVAVTTVRPGVAVMTYDDARLVAAEVRHAGGALVVVDLRDVEETTTAALACLVACRRELMAEGRDLHVRNLRDQPRHICEVNRLEGLLPEDRP